MSMQVDAASVLEKSFQICEGNDSLSQEIKEIIEMIRWDLSKHKYGSEHPYLALTLCHFAWKRQATRFLEVGFECGGTTIPLSCVCEAMDGEYLALDNMQSPYCNEESLAYIESYVSGRVDAFARPGFDTTKLSGQYDFVFMDHHKPLYEPHFKELVDGGFLAPGALVFFHDVDFCKLTSGSNYEAFKPVIEYVEANDLGECHYLRKGFEGVTCPDLGVVVLRS